jgi:hypothetical protein
MNDKAIVPVDQTGQVQPMPSGQSLSLFDKIADPMKAIEQMGVFIAQSGMFGKMNENQGKVLAWHCLTKKKDPFEFQREFHILEDGKITKRADAMAADFIRRGGKIKWLSDLNDDKEAKATFVTRDGDSYTWSFSINDAKGYSETREGYLKKNWRDSMPDMLRARLISKSIRILDPEVNAGVYTPEELRDNLTVPVTPSPTGLFDQSPQATQPPTAAAPIQTIDEVVASAQAAIKDLAQPVQQALPLSPSTIPPQALDKPAIPQQLTIKEMHEAVIAKFKGYNSTSVDLFFTRKVWIKPGQCIMDLDNDHIKRAYDSINHLIAFYITWAAAEEKKAKVEADRKAKEGAK